MKKEDVKDILDKYSKKLGKQVENYDESFVSNQAFSREYMIFRREVLSHVISLYEKVAYWCGKKFAVKLSKKDELEIRKSIEITHLSIEPYMAGSFAFIFAIFMTMLGFIFGAISFVLGNFSFGTVFLSLLIILVGFALIKPLTDIPNQIANKWRLKAGNQMVLCVLYIVMYMRHTSNLEHAIKFASQHIGNPLALDFRKVFWDVEVGKYATIKESLDNYLLKWKDYNLEFVEAFHLIGSSLYEGSEEKRLERLEKALQVILDSTYDRMMHFAHNLKNPITMLHMLGIILPILGLIILPLIGSLLGVKWWALGIFYNIILPIFVFFMGQRLLMKRPSGYGEQDILEMNPELKKYTKVNFLGARINPLLPALFVFLFFCFLGFMPLIIHQVNPNFDVSLGDKLGNLLDYKVSGSGNENGPFGVGAALFSLFVILGVGFGIGIYYRLRTKNLIEIRNRIKSLEREFSGSLFQLGNRIGDGIPAEIAFGKVAENMKGTNTGKFFSLVDANIRSSGMGLEDAIFDNKRGAILYFPSALIDSSMRVLVESSRKGPQVVAKSLVSISVYVERIRRVAERLKDLLADITSSMKGQINFMTPLIAGVVVGLGSMMTNLIGRITGKIGEGFLEGGGGATGFGFDVNQIVSIFPIDKIMPPFFFQLVVGLYVVEVIIILTVLSNSIENGFDKLNEQYNIGKNLYMGVALYFIVAFLVTLAFTFLAGAVSVVSGH
jgi:hypothetical protein